MIGAVYICINNTPMKHFVLDDELYRRFQDKVAQGANVAELYGGQLQGEYVFLKNVTGDSEFKIKSGEDLSIHFRVIADSIEIFIINFGDESDAIIDAYLGIVIKRFKELFPNVHVDDIVAVNSLDYDQLNPTIIKALEVFKEIDDSVQFSCKQDDIIEHEDGRTALKLRITYNGGHTVLLRGFRIVITPQDEVKLTVHEDRPGSFVEGNLDYDDPIKMVSGKDVPLELDIVFPDKGENIRYYFQLSVRYDVPSAPDAEKKNLKRVYTKYYEI